MGKFNTPRQISRIFCVLVAYVTCLNYFNLCLMNPLINDGEEKEKQFSPFAVLNSLLLFTGDMLNKFYICGKTKLFVNQEVHFSFNLTVLVL